MDMHAAYRGVGSYRAAAEICGTTPKTVKRSVEAACERGWQLSGADSVPLASSSIRTASRGAVRARPPSSRP